MNARSNRAGRRRLPDVRLLIGILLVAGATAGVVGIVAASDDSVTVYAARGPLGVGDRVTAAELETRSVRLDALAGFYLTEGAVPQEGLVITRTIAAGELVPVSAVGSTASQRWTAVVISVPGRLPQAIGPGATVDVWSSRHTGSGRFEPPRVIATGATVVRVLEGGSFMAAEGLGVEVLVTRTALPALLDAIASDDVLSVVPVHLPAGR